MAGELVPHNPMAHYRQRLLFWNRLLDTATDEQRAAQANNAIAELDSLWRRRGLMNEDFFVSGEGMWTETVNERDLGEDVSEENIMARFPKSGHITVVQFGTIMAMRGVSEGFSVMEYPNEPHAILSYQFKQNLSFGGENPYISADIGHRIQIKLGTLSLLPVRDVQITLQKLHPRFGVTSPNN